MSQDILLSLIDPDPEQPRKHFDENALGELADSIKEQSLLSPILVRPNDDGVSYQIVHGERRWRAHQIAGLDTIRAEVRELDDEEAYTASVIENEQRENLSVVETAKALQVMMDSQDLTQAGVAAKISKSRSWVAQKLRLLNLPDVTQGLVRDSKISEGHARQLLKLKTAELGDRIDELAKQAAASAWSVSRLTSEVDAAILGDVGQEQEMDVSDVIRLAFYAGAMCVT